MSRRRPPAAMTRSASSIASNARASGARRHNKGMPLQFTTSYTEDSLALLRQYKKLAEGAIEQVTDAELVAVLDPEMNSIAQTVKHMAGNMRSRWTDFLTSDGEKPDRARDSEFVAPPSTREGVMKI